MTSSKFGPFQTPPLPPPSSLITGEQLTHSFFTAVYSDSRPKFWSLADPGCSIFLRTQCKYFIIYVSIWFIIWENRTFLTVSHQYSLVMPKFIRDHPGLLNKILRLEQEGEHIHALMNRSENKFKSTKDKSERYWQMLQDYENKLYTSK